jgi:hypothetical protein
MNRIRREQLREKSETEGCTKEEVAELIDAIDDIENRITMLGNSIRFETVHITNPVIEFMAKNTPKKSEDEHTMIDGKRVYLQGIEKSILGADHVMIQYHNADPVFIKFDPQPSHDHMHLIHALLKRLET